MIDIKETDGINIGNKKFIVLVGLMGSGKTSLGKAIAKLLNLPFLDSDLEIENISGKTIKQLFDGPGEAVFRQIEEKTIKDILNGNPVVLATGGGAVTSKGTTTLINQKALSIWLKADIDLLHRRTLRRKHRPLLTHENSLATLKKLANSREKYYKQSDITFQIKDEKISLSAKRLLESIKNFNQE